MKRFAYLVALFLAIAGATEARAASISTLFAQNNGGSFGGAVYFDITVGASDITITGIDTNTAEFGTFDFSVYLTAAGGTFVGNATNPAAWSVVATGTGNGLGVNSPSPVNLSNTISLLANTTYGIAFVMGPQAGHDYTNGTGSNQAYSNGDLALSLGSATNAPFTAGEFNPRVWNGTIYYDLGSAQVPEPSTWMLMVTGLTLGVVAIQRRRRKR